MCSIKDGFKLCTCNNIKKKDADWILERHVKTHPINDIMGTWIPNFLELDDELRVAKIIDELNSRNCFDFEYKPVAKDYLSFCFNRKNNLWAYFVFMNKRWVEDEGSPFEDWKQQLKTYKLGKIKNE